jgi:hypothetical protein
VRNSNGGASPPAAALVLQRRAHDLAERASAEPDATGIGRIGRDQQRRLLAAPHRALEPRRDFDREQHRAGREQPVEFRFVST